MTDGNTHAIAQHLDEREDWDAGYQYLNLTFNARTERYDIDPDTEFNRVYFAKRVK